MTQFPIDVNFFNFLDTLIFKTAREATIMLNRRYPGWNLRVKVRKNGDTTIYDGAGNFLASIRAKR